MLIHCQLAARRRVDRRADRVKRAATLINCRRTVAVLAFAWKVEVSAPVARMRLKAIAASTRRTSPHHMSSSHKHVFDLSVTCLVALHHRAASNA